MGEASKIFQLETRQDKDFTVYGKEDSAIYRLFQEYVSERQTGENPPKRYSFEEPVNLVGTVGGQPHSLRARALLCKCYEDGYVSATFRIVDIVPEHFQPESTGQVLNLDGCNYAAQKSEHVWESAMPDILYGRLWPSSVKEELKGLIYITGATKSGKNFQANAFIHKYLTDLRFQSIWKETRNRRPHLITFEDPIEAYLLSSRGAGDADARPISPVELQARGIDYTPRQRHRDSNSLAEIIGSALRQTPSALFVGETRNNDELRELIDFAGTGHLVITTGHAHSLREAMGKLLSACTATTPAAKRELANKLCAVVHLYPHHTAGRLLRVPAVFRSNARGQQAFMAEGRGCLLPFATDPDDLSAYCWGKHWFVSQLPENPKAGAGEFDSLKDWALRQDLIGM